jgi:ABC-type branched-subunit amino acid transport system substrate-binding protein
MTSSLRFLLLLLLLGAVRPGTAASAETALRFGMSTALSGPAAALGLDMQRGVQAGFAHLNRQGGIRGRPLTLVALDDGYEPGRSAPNMRQLLEKEEVLAVIGNVGTPTAIASLPVIRDHRTLLFAPFTGAGVLRRTPPERYVINIRASYTEEITAMVDALIKKGGLRPEEIAFFTQRDGYGDAGYVGGFSALKKHGLRDERDVLHLRYQRNTLAVENALADLLLVEPPPKAVIMVGTYAPCAKFLKLARQAGLETLFLSVSFVDSQALADQLGNDFAGVIVTQVVPAPTDTRLALVRSYLADLKSVAGDARPSFVSFEGYLAARTLGLALTRYSGPLDRHGVIEALEALGDFDLGLGAALHLSPTRHQASHGVWPTKLRHGEFVPLDWAQIGQLLPQEIR